MARIISLVFLLLTCFIAFITAASVYRFAICPQLPYASDEHLAHFLNLFDFYEQIPPDSILFLGNSQAVEGIDTYIISNASSIPYEIFNLGLYGDPYAGRSLMLDRIISRRPKIVFVTFSSLNVNDAASLNFLYYKPIYFELRHDKISKDILDQNLQSPYLFDPVGKAFYSLFRIPPPRCQWRGSHILNLGKAPVKPIVNIGHSNTFIGNFKAPHANLSEDFKMEIETNPQTLRSWTFYEEENTRKEILSTFINTLRASNITVIAIDMPLSPAFLNYIPVESQQNYHRFINSSVASAVPYYSFTYSYNASYFFDGVHLNAKGRNNFSLALAKIIEEHT